MLTLALAQVPPVTGLCGTCRSPQLVVSPLPPLMLVGGWGRVLGRQEGGLRCTRGGIVAQTRSYHTISFTLHHIVTCFWVAQVPRHLTAPWSSRLHWIPRQQTGLSLVSSDLAGGKGDTFSPLKWNDMTVHPQCKTASYTTALWCYCNPPPSEMCESLYTGRPEPASHRPVCCRGISGS